MIHFEFILCRVYVRGSNFILLHVDKIILILKKMTKAVFLGGSLTHHSKYIPKIPPWLQKTYHHCTWKRMR